MQKADFIWTVGFSGNTAIVNRSMRSRLQAPAWGVLLDQGYLRAAFCSALWDSQQAGDQSILEACTQALGQRVGQPLSVEEAKRLLGVQQIPATNVKVLAV